MAAPSRARIAHPRPEALGIEICRQSGDCMCFEVCVKLGYPPGTRINRTICEHRYKAGIEAVKQMFFGWERGR